MNIKYINRLILIILFLAGFSFASDINKTGTTAAAFLKMGVGARAIGMGGAFTGTANDISSMYWNPGGLALLNRNEAAFNHTNWFADLALDYAGFALNLGGFGNLGASITVLSSDEMLVRTIEDPTGTGEYFDYSSMAVGLSYAKKLTDNFSIGFTAKYIHEKVYNMSASAIAFDIGTLYKIDVLNELRIASSISNYGTKMQLSGRDNMMVQSVGAGGSNLIRSYTELDEFDLPILFRFGLAADVIKNESIRLTTAVDAVHPNDHTEYLNTGAELAWNEILFIRAGYKSLFEKDTEQGITAGIGINYDMMSLIKLKVDYAYEDFGDLGDLHYIMVGIEF